MPTRPLLDALDDYRRRRGWKLLLRFVDENEETIPPQDTIGPTARRQLVIWQREVGPLYARELYPNAATLDEFAVLLFECLGVPIHDLQVVYGRDLLDLTGKPLDLNEWP